MESKSAVEVYLKTRSGRLETVCRGCLVSGSSVQSMFRPDGRDAGWDRRLRECASVRAEKDDGRPQGLCQGCRRALVDALQFIERCRETETLLAGLKPLAPVTDDLFEEEAVVVKVEPDDEPTPADGRLSCRTCGRKFQTEQGLRVHATRMHGVHSGTDVREAPPTISRGLFKCDNCPFVARRKAELRRHMGRHKEHAPHGCDVCGRRYASAESLLAHRSKHALYCRICYRHFDDAGSLRQHYAQPSHRPYTCHLCPYTVYRKPSLDKHVASAHSDSPASNQQFYGAPE